MKTQYLVPTILAASVLSACGGGGGSIAGIGGTGITASGTIDGFGSIFVNGVRYDTDLANIAIDSDSGNADDLRLGMVVTVNGTISSDGTEGIASSVTFDDDLQGPISAINVDANGTVLTLTILGVSVEVDQLSTVFDNTSFDTLAINDVIEVSGFLRSDGVIQATRIENEGVFQDGISEIELQGIISNLTGSDFEIGGFTINAAGADTSDLEDTSLSNGLNVEVRGTLVGTTITATAIELEDGPFDDDDDDVELEGIITDFVDNSNFRVLGQLVNAANAELEPAGLILQNDLLVEIEGSIVDGVLIASEVEGRDGEVELAAPIQSLDLGVRGGTITLGFAPGNVTFTVNSQTELDDETNTFNPISFGDLSIGDFVEVEALLSSGQLTATELQLEEPGDQQIEGPVESFVANTSITILGLTYSVVGARFEDSNDAATDVAVFFSQLNNGDIVELEDNDPADGTADEVEIED